MLSRDHEDGRATRQPQGVGSEAYLNGTSQVPAPEDARKDGHIRGRSKLFMKDPGSLSTTRVKKSNKRDYPSQARHNVVSGKQRAVSS
ncbi:MAG: hypothetical protein KJP05_02520 [Deltaproteobacteria bacterium]|nr:hypothetical protein [Deltaproteobacteria bacterium]